MMKFFDLLANKSFQIKMEIETPPNHLFPIPPNSISVATHIQINETNRDGLKTKSVPPKNSMNLFITEALSIGIMIPQQG